MSVLSHFSARATAAQLTPSEKLSISNSIAYLNARVSNYFGNDVSSQLLFGSYPRETILPRSMDVHSDVDYMLVFSQSGFQPQTYLDRLRRFVEARYSRSEIAQSSPTIVLNLNHIRFELVPALYTPYYGYQIPSGPTAWQTSDPVGFASQLSAKNQAEKYLLKPAIRLLKLWNTQNNWPFASYWLEQYAVGQFFWGNNNVRDYLLDLIAGLPVDPYIAWKREKVQRAHRLVADIRRLEGQGSSIGAEVAARNLIT